MLWIDNSVFSLVPRLSAWHCPHLLWRRCCCVAAFDQYLLPAANPPHGHCCFALYLVCSKLYSIVCLLLCRQDWWNSSTFANYYRTWNVVVHDWLYCYVYKECYLVRFVCLTTNEMHSVLPTYHFVVTLQYYTIKSCVRHIWSAESEAQAVVSGGRWQGGSKRRLVKNNMS